jgi:pyrroloquinoline quinone biosynthesis protein B
MSVTQDMGRDVRVTVLGISQDGGFPQAGCNSNCCEPVKKNPALSKHPVSLGIIGLDGSKHLIEATRDLAWQLNLWNSIDPSENKLASLWITHAHHGHIDGLGLFGREVINSKNLNVYCSDKLSNLIKNTPNWNLLIELENIEIKKFKNAEYYALSPECGFSIKPIEVPHRAELSDMHAFLIKGPNKTLLFLPDHDAWVSTLDFVNKNTIIDWLNSEHIDIALIDGTFWSSNELVNRTQKIIPHPTVSETLQLIGEKKVIDPEIKFTHLNHTNPLHYESSDEYKQVEKMGWGVTKEGEFFNL